MSNTEFFVRQTRHYSPLLLRGFLWVAIAMLTDLRHSIGDLVNLAQTTWMQWVDALVGSFLAGAIALRLFLDQSVSRFHDDTKGKL